MILQAMFIESDAVKTLQVAVLLLPVLGLIVAFAWIRRITDPSEPSFWRYRRARRRLYPTHGWIATRIQMAIAVLVFLLIAAAPAFGVVGTYLAPLQWFVGTTMAGIGTLWIFRIARADPEPDAKAWRYRGR